jgi:P27 family predicted phage terminase small subunit
MRGRPPKPPKLKLLTGNPGKRALPAAAPPPAPGEPVCPAWLCAEGKRIWAKLLPDLPPGVAGKADSEILALLCQAHVEFRWATREIRKKDGRTYETEQGQVCPHPAVGMQRSAWAAIQKLSALFGLDPASRSRLNLKPADKPAGVMSRNRA